MGKLYFITGNSGKLNEAKNVMSNLEQIDLDLPEIQEIDARRIIEAKLDEALKHNDGEFIVEDTSVYIDCLGGLPGPLIKWFLETLKIEGISELVGKYDDKKASAKTIVGYSDGERTMFFEGVVEGEIVAPRGKNGFGWDKMFLPGGSNKTFGEMTLEEKEKFSMRKIALLKLKDYLERQ